MNDLFEHFNFAAYWLFMCQVYGVDIKTIKPELVPLRSSYRYSLKEWAVQSAKTWLYRCKEERVPLRNVYSVAGVMFYVFKNIANKDDIEAIHEYVKTRIKARGGNPAFFKGKPKEGGEQ